MTKKKKSRTSLASKADSKTDSTSSSVPPSPRGQSPTLARSKQSKPQGSTFANSSSKTKQQEPSTSALIICRNKHWRYISSFHGPWLQLPPEVLETLAHRNYSRPRPQPIDPAVFFDLVKIRRLVEEATDLAVRAANGTTSAALNISLNATNGLLGGGSSAALGFGIGGGGGNAKLSRERRHRMREHATQKLARAYRLDEIAASVATMQSASALEDVAKLVLQRNEHEPDAKYVHFFHEKIPARSLAECTSLQPLDEVIANSPYDGSIYRTRAVTRVFKDDYTGAARDLTEALAVYRLYTVQHGEGRRQLEIVGSSGGRAPLPHDHRSDHKLDDADQPSSLETQLLFHRGGVYLSLACQHIHAALDAFRLSQKAKLPNPNAERESEATPTLSPAGKEAYRRWLEARKIVKTNARKAIRDYLSFLSYFDYTPDLPLEHAEDFLRKGHAVSSSCKKGRCSRGHSVYLTESGNQSESTNSHTGTAEVNGSNNNPDVPATKVYELSTLFSAQPPENLPPYPVESQELMRPGDSNGSINSSTLETHEVVTYHPLLTDALHSLLLCHALAQTSKKELLRHAHMVARIARVCDGYPIFLAPRSPARADWIEVLHRADNWIELKQSWETLCAPAPLPGQAISPTERKEMTDNSSVQRKQEAISEALTDDQVQDEERICAAVRAREKRAPEQHTSSQQKNSNSTNGAHSWFGQVPKRWAQEDGKEYPICTERAEAIARWIKEAPMTTGEGKSKAKKGTKKRPLKTSTLEDSFHAMSVEENGAID
ncbi:hypothetical protein VTO42DRAFT_1373 [Malbranchea cinnamomea]